MDSRQYRDLMEAYVEVYAPQEVDEATAMAKRGYDETKLRKRAGGGEAADRATALENRPTYGDAKKAKQRSEYARKQRGDFRNTASSSPGLHGYAHKSNDPKVKALQAARGAQRGALTPNERKQLNMEMEYDVFDIVMEFLQAEGYVDTLEEAEWVMANLIDEEAVDIILGEAITSEKGKAKAAEMIAKRTTASGRAKSGQGANVAMIKHIGRSNRDGLLGTPPNRKVAGSNWPKSYTGIGGTGNKAARRAAELKKEDFELWVNELVEEGYDLSDYTWDEMYDIYETEQLDEITASMGRRAKEYNKKKEQDAFMARQKAHQDKMKNDPEYAAKRKKVDAEARARMGKGNPMYKKEEFEAWLDEAMTKYEKNRKRAAQRAAARNAARDQGKTGVVPGVGYVTPRRERETWTDESGKTRHAKGL